MRATSGTGPATKGLGHRHARTSLRCSGGARHRRDRERSASGRPGPGRRAIRGRAGCWPEAGVSVGHSGWFWGDPQPQGNYLERDRLRRIARVRGRRLRHAAPDRRRRRDLGGAADGDRRSARHRARDRLQHGGHRGRLRAAPLRRRRQDLHAAAVDGKRPELSQSRSPRSAFPSPSVGYLMTEDGSILRTDDGGTTFSKQDVDPGQPTRPAARARRRTSSSRAPTRGW